MLQEALLAGESLGAEAALVGLLPRVGAEVLLQVVLLHETLRAERALVGPLPRVGALVLGQVMPPDEVLPAVRAVEGALSRVGPEVIGQFAFVREALLAGRTLVRPGARVAHLVTEQVVRAAETPGTVGAAQQVLGDGLGRRFQVGVLMEQQVDVEPEALVAQGASPQLLSRLMSRLLRGHQGASIHEWGGEISSRRGETAVTLRLFLVANLAVLVDVFRRTALVGTGRLPRSVSRPQTGIEVLFFLYNPFYE